MEHLNSPLKKFKNFLLLMVLPLFCVQSMAQDIHFSQFTMTPILLDASMTGKQGDYRVFLNYRDQWRSVASPYKTYGVSMETAFNKKRNKDHFFGAGFSVYSDRAGDIKMGITEVKLSGAFHILVDEGKLISAGLSGGFGQLSLDQSALRYDNQYDPTSTGGEVMYHNSSLGSGESVTPEPFFYPDFGLGVSYGANIGSKSINVSSNNGYDGKKCNIGIAMHHIPKFKNSYLGNKTEKLSFKYLAHFWFSIGARGTKLAIQPSGFVAYQNGATEFTLGSHYRYTLQESSKYTGLVKGAAVTLGTHYRTGDAFVLSALLELGSYAIGASYDINTSGVTNNPTVDATKHGRGGFEISLRFMNPNPFTGGKTSRSRI
jgi:type IX secretion system PorP/SprF family membrane protein